MGGCSCCQTPHPRTHYACAAVSMSFTTSSGWETIATWFVGTSMVVAPCAWRTSARHPAGSLDRHRQPNTRTAALSRPGPHHVTEGGRRQRLLHRVHDLCLHRINISGEVVHEI